MTSVYQKHTRQPGPKCNRSHRTPDKATAYPSTEPVPMMPNGPAVDAGWLGSAPAAISASTNAAVSLVSEPNCTAQPSADHDPHHPNLVTKASRAWVGGCSGQAVESHATDFE